jgi:hypothetical protein
MALVVLRWTGSTVAGILAGMLYAFNAHLLTRLVHLQALHIEFLPLALLALDQVLRVGVGNREPGSSAEALAKAEVAARALRNANRAGGVGLKTGRSSVSYNYQFLPV